MARQVRHRQGKPDVLDAIAAARSVLAGTALGAPKSKGGNVEGIRVFTVVRQSATKARTQALNQIQSLVSTAPERPARAAPSAHHHPDHRDVRCLPTPGRLGCQDRQQGRPTWPGPPSAAPGRRTRGARCPTHRAGERGRPRPARSLRCRTRHSCNTGGLRR